MSSPSTPATDKENPKQASIPAGKSRRAKAAEHASSAIKVGKFTVKFHSLNTIIIDVTTSTITLPGAIDRWQPVLDVAWRDFDSFVRYVIKHASGGGKSDLARMAGKPASPAAPDAPAPPAPAEDAGAKGTKPEGDDA